FLFVLVSHDSIITCCSSPNINSLLSLKFVFHFCYLYLSNFCLKISAHFTNKKHYISNLCIKISAYFTNKNYFIRTICIKNYLFDQCIWVYISGKEILVDELNWVEIGSRFNRP